MAKLFFKLSIFLLLFTMLSSQLTEESCRSLIQRSAVQVYQQPYDRSQCSDNAASWRDNRNIKTP